MRKLVENNKERSIWCGHWTEGPTGNIYNPWENATENLLEAEAF